MSDLHQGSFHINSSNITGHHCILTQSTAVLHKYLNDELKLLCYSFPPRLHRISRVFHVQRNASVFEACGRPPCARRKIASVHAAVHPSLNTHARLTALFLGLPMWAGTVQPIWILLEQEIVSGSGISWAICKSAPRSRQITMPSPHYSVFLQAGCPSCRPTNSVKALKARSTLHNYC